LDRLSVTKIYKISPCFIRKNENDENHQLLAAALAISALAGCATESSQAVAVPTVTSAYKPYVGPRSLIAVGKFDNRSSFMRGVFSDGVDRLGGQAKTMLISHLQQTNRFSVLDRDNLGEMKQEAGFKQQAQHQGRRFHRDRRRDRAARKWATTSCSASPAAARPR
jgi:curli biogenesis system outer membrane secretion channel CsgG